MTWDAATPADTAQFSTAATTDFRNAKQMVRERAVAWNGAIYEHKTNTDSSFGVHEASKVSWVKWHDTYVDMETFCTPISSFEKTLHYVLATEQGGLYSIRDGALVLFGVNDHDSAVVEDAQVEHPQYIARDYPTSYAYGGQELITTTLTLNDTSEFLPLAHKDQDLTVAHPDYTPSYSDVAAGSVPLEFPSGVGFLYVTDPTVDQAALGTPAKPYGCATGGGATDAGVSVWEETLP